MTAGMNAHFRFTRLIYGDDEVGGAYPSGTLLYDNILGRLDEDPTNTMYLQQGLETVKTFSAMFWGSYLLFREQDEVEVTSPPNHEYYGQKFRVVDRITSSNHPAQKRNVWIAKLTRSQVAHKNPYQ
jgi:hypothetical protein